MNEGTCDAEDSKASLPSKSLAGATSVTTAERRVPAMGTRTREPTVTVSTSLGRDQVVQRLVEMRQRTVDPHTSDGSRGSALPCRRTYLCAGARTRTCARACSRARPHARGRPLRTSLAGKPEERVAVAEVVNHGRPEAR
ncbi:hypothetical protein GCM10025876_38720 [Demequina litorisediminis]|uniref:Uncharacterized protein n=1 Tax=Demequina litorisediminis TaxID=1849022 RepID=A0ABQ6ILW6_9MICO|nr:hypothetical protein GCM10025876_38720 [Demequina litorisediminis]